MKIHRKKDGVWLLLLLTLVLFSSFIIANPPQPHNVQGRVFHADGTTGVENGIPVRINDTVSGDVVFTRTDAPPIPSLLGTYSATINGSDGDGIVVTAWNATHYGINNSETLAATTTSVNVILNTSRPSETNVTITIPTNNSARNLSIIFNVTATIAILGSDATSCNATISFSSIDVMNISSGESFTQILGDMPLGSSNVTIWNVSGLQEGSSNITVGATCASDGLNFDRENSDTVSNITIEDITPPVVTLIDPANGTWSTTNNLTLRYNVSDVSGITSCSLYFDGQLNHTNFDIATTDAPKNFTVLNVSSTCSGEWAACSNVFADDTNDAISDEEGQEMVLYNFSFNVSSAATITGIEVIHDSRDPDLGSLNISVSADGGSTWSSPKSRVLTDTETTYVEGNASDLWGFLWTPLTINSNTDFRVRLVSVGGSNEWFVEYSRVRVHYDQEQAFFINNTAQGNHTWLVSCVDNSSNANQGNSSERVVRVDSIVPTVSLISPDNNSVFTNSTVLFEYNVSDNFIVENCSLIVDGSTQQTNTSIAKDTAQNFTLTLSGGPHTWQVTCFDTAGNGGSSVTRQINVSGPDLEVTSADIVFIPNVLVEGLNITINATVHNRGGVNATDVIVQFFENDPDAGGSQINGNFSVNVSTKNNVTVSATYETVIGINDIVVLVDPPLGNGSISETNESNNKANRTIAIPSFHTYFGEVSADVLLDSASNISVFTWINESNIAGNVFVADSDSSIDWASLLALSRNVSNNFTFDDFAEIDSVLNLTPLNDSINRTFTFSNQPRATTNFTVFSVVVEHVPIINSTNTSDFVTGILWDSSDVNGGEYNGTQDVIFVTSINQNKPGSFGIYDYEIKFPANLRKYITPNSQNTVSFYTELQ